jgi:hypothetical protein
MRIKLSYILGIIFLGVLSVLTYFSQIVSPILLTFCGFVLGYLIIVFVVFVLLGRYGS